MRLMHLTTPHSKGADVKTLQKAINQRLTARQDGLHVAVDGEFGPATAHAEQHAGWLLGVADAHARRARCQTIILHPELRNSHELDRADRIAKQLAAARAEQFHGPHGAVRLALQVARHRPPYTENPAGTNTDHGGIIDQAQREVGIAASFYCGAGYHYLLLHGGGLNVTPDVRYCPYTINHAKAGTGGFREWIPVEHAAHAQPADAVLYQEGAIAGHVELLIDVPSDGQVHTVGWNTSPQLGSGSQSNGGGIFERHRPLSGSFPVMGFARPRWP